MEREDLEEIRRYRAGDKRAGEALREKYSLILDTLNQQIPKLGDSSLYKVLQEANLGDNNYSLEQSLLETAKLSYGGLNIRLVRKTISLRQRDNLR